jgi:hypothetical protein
MTGLLHHKYAIIDAEMWNARTAVITGSHNWSGSAETINNENTLFIFSAAVANQYLQEFGARYAEAGGRAYIPTGVAAGVPAAHAGAELPQNYPNPFADQTSIGLTLPDRDLRAGFTLVVYDLLGRRVIDLTPRLLAGAPVLLHRDELPAPGVYYYRLTGPAAASSRAMILLR